MEIWVVILSSVIVWGVWFGIAYHKKNRLQMAISSLFCLLAVIVRLFGVLASLASVALSALSVFLWKWKDGDFLEPKTDNNPSIEFEDKRVKTSEADSESEKNEENLDIPATENVEDLKSDLSEESKEALKNKAGKEIIIFAFICIFIFFGIVIGISVS